MTSFFYLFIIKISCVCKVSWKIWSIPEHTYFLSDQDLVVLVRRFIPLHPLFLPLPNFTQIIHYHHDPQQHHFHHLHLLFFLILLYLSFISLIILLFSFDVFSSIIHTVLQLGFSLSFELKKIRRSVVKAILFKMSFKILMFLLCGIF